MVFQTILRMERGNFHITSLRLHLASYALCTHARACTDRSNTDQAQTCEQSPNDPSVSAGNAQEPAMHGHSTGCPDAEQGAWQINTAKAAKSTTAVHKRPNRSWQAALTPVLSEERDQINVCRVHGKHATNLATGKSIHLGDFVTHRGREACTRLLPICIKVKGHGSLPHEPATHCRPLLAPKASLPSCFSTCMCWVPITAMSQQRRPVSECKRSSEATAMRSQSAFAPASQSLPKERWEKQVPVCPG